MIQAWVHRVRPAASVVVHKLLIVPRTFLSARPVRKHTPPLHRYTSISVCTIQSCCPLRPSCLLGSVREDDRQPAHAMRISASPVQRQDASRSMQALPASTSIRGHIIRSSSTGGVDVPTETARKTSVEISRGERREVEHRSRQRESRRV